MFGAKFCLSPVRTPLEFVETILDQIYQYLSRTGQATRWLKNILSTFGETEIKGVIKLPPKVESDWKKVLTRTLEDIVKHQSNQSKQFVFLWDEVPFMLDNIKQNKGEQVATEVLDSLRQLRQTYSQLRMVYTGSIGLHHILSAFRNTGYNGAPTNDMQIQDIPPLSEENATILAGCLLKGEGVQCPEGLTITAREIAKSVDGIPYYIHHLVSILKSQRQPVNTKNLEKIINNALLNPQNNLQMEHYQERIKKYYKDYELQYALALLDILSTSQQSLTLKDLLQELSVHINQNPDKEITREVLKLLAKDHYLNREDSSNYGYYFLHPLIKSYWQLTRN